MNWQDHITVDPEICHGRACITGTRVLVSTVLDNLADGLNSEEVMRSYPSVTRKSIQAAVCYASELAASKEEQAMTNQKVADLTVGEFRELCHDMFAEIVQEIFDDPDRGLALREEVAERLGRSLADVDAGGETISLRR